FIPLDVEFDESNGLGVRECANEMVECHHFHGMSVDGLAGVSFEMRRDQSVIALVDRIDPKRNGSDFIANGGLNRRHPDKKVPLDAKSLELLKIARLRLKSIHMEARTDHAREHPGGITDIGARIEDVAVLKKLRVFVREPEERIFYE